MKKKVVKEIKDQRDLNLKAAVIAKFTDYFKFQPEYLLKNYQSGKLYKYDIHDGVLFKSVVQYGSSSDYYKLSFLLAKHLKMSSKNNYKNIVHNILSLSYYNNDQKILENIRQIKSSDISNNPVTNNALKYRDSMHADAVWSYFQEVIRKYGPIQPTKYLDIGCGDCNKTAMIGKKFGLESSNIYGIDIPQWDRPYQRNKLAIQFKEIPAGVNLPFADNEFDLISAFMVLHHVKILEQELREIARVTKSGGIFIIREHDIWTTSEAQIVDIEHLLYDVGTENIPYKDAISNFYSQYYNWMEWDVLIEKHGFKWIYSHFDSAEQHISPTNYYYSYYVRI